jgi:LacI family transcriptional regulator
MPVTINEVAKEAGVSITTVSRVVNNNYPVKKETREKIEKAIEKLNYKPNAMARSLITKKTSMIGIIVPGITNLFFPTIVEAIEEQIKQRGYSIALSNTEGDAAQEREVADRIVARQVDGIIVIDPRQENLKSGFYDNISKSVPLIIINGAPSGSKCSFVSYDEEVGTREAFDYLISLGHKKISFVRGHKSFSYDIKEQIYGETLEREGLEYHKVINVGKGNSIEVVDSTEKMIEEIFSKEERPTAVFACNDLMAVGVLNASSKLGIKVPEELSVIGCDNTLIAHISSPKLTSVDLDMKEIGARAAEELMGIIENSERNRSKVIMDTKLIIRDSCAEAINN